MAARAHRYDARGRSGHDVGALPVGNPKARELAGAVRLPDEQQQCERRQRADQCNRPSRCAWDSAAHCIAWSTRRAKRARAGFQPDANRVPDLREGR
jgi:hypothetical protein